MKALLRRVAYVLLSPLGLTVENQYSDDTAAACGYSGSISIHNGQCIGFRTTEGTLNFSWQ